MEINNATNGTSSDDKNRGIEHPFLNGFQKNEQRLSANYFLMDNDKSTLIACTPQIALHSTVAKFCGAL